MKDLSKISGLAVLVFNLGLIIWNLIFLYLINPKNVKAITDENEIPIFPKEVTDKLLQTSNTIFIFAGIMNIIGSFLVSKR